MDRCWTDFTPILTRRCQGKVSIVFRHDGALQFGGCFDVLDVFFVEVGEAVFDLRSHRHRLLDVLVLGLQDGDAVVDDGALFELRTLFAGRVFREHGFFALEDMRAAVDRAEGHVSECAGEGLNRLIRVECYFSHSGGVFKRAILLP